MSSIFDFLVLFSCSAVCLAYLVGIEHREFELIDQEQRAHKYIQDLRKRRHISNLLRRYFILLKLISDQEVISRVSFSALL